MCMVDYIVLGLSAPLVPQPLANLSSVTSLSPCFKLIGMFDPYRLVCTV